MSHYRVSYFKNLLSSDGHQFKCLQQQFDLFNVANVEEAAQTAARQFENLHGLHSLKIFADVIEIETVENERARRQS
jgi:hypothetical protein